MVCACALSEILSSYYSISCLSPSTLRSIPCYAKGFGVQMLLSSRPAKPDNGRIAEHGIHTSAQPFLGLWVLEENDGVK